MADSKTHIKPLETGRRWKFAECEYVEISRQLFVGGGTVRLESKPLDVLQHLLEHPAQILTKNELIEAVWSTATTDQSLATAIAKLRKAFGGPRDAVILNVSGIGYRMGVPVACTIDYEPGPPSFHLEAGDVIPGRPDWVAARRLGIGEPGTVWVAEHRKTHEVHVFKFAVDGIRLRALQREATLSRLFRKKLKSERGFVHILDWNFERSPFFIESEYCGLNLFEFSETEEFRRMPEAERVSLAAQLAEVVGAANALGILHNDLKPGNILIMSRDEDDESSSGEAEKAKNWQVKVADFGVASLNDPQRLLEMQITSYGAFEAGAEDRRKGANLGNAVYCAPELRVPGATPTVLGDVFALGVLLYQIACGDFLDSPSPGWEARILDPILRQDIAAAANIDPALRISSASDLAQRLRNIERRRLEQQEREEALASAQRAQQSLAKVRLQRPWIALSIIALVAGLCVSLWFYRRAAEQRDLANSRNATLSTMYYFLSEDILNQTNPFSASAHSGHVQQETLLGAIDAALPQIGIRFRNSPEIAGRLLETFAAALEARTEYIKAARVYGAAAQQFREAEGPLSQNALIAEYRQENTEIRSQTAGPIAQGKAAFDRQQQLLLRLHYVSPELQAWHALAGSACFIYGPHPEEGLPLLRAAVHRAESTPSFDPSLLSNLRMRFCGIYLRIGNGQNAERAARQIIARIKASGGGGTALFEPDMFLEEALFEEGKYKESAAQGRLNYQAFLKVLGPQNQLALAALTNQEQAEGADGDYDLAIRDGLALHTIGENLPSGKFIQESSLSDVAADECHSGRFRSGIEHARQVIQESSVATASQPLFVNLSTFTIAECLIGRQEISGLPPDSATLQKAARLLKSVDVPLVSRSPGLSAFEGSVDMAKAELALLRGLLGKAREYSDKAAPYLEQPTADAYERKALTDIKASLAHASAANR